MYALILNTYDYDYDYDYGWDSEVVAVSDNEVKLKEHALKNYPEYKFEDFECMIGRGYNHCNVIEVDLV